MSAKMATKRIFTDLKMLQILLYCGQMSPGNRGKSTGSHTCWSARQTVTSCHTWRHIIQ